MMGCLRIRRCATERIGVHKAGEAWVVEAGESVVEASFGIAFVAGEFVVLGACVLGGVFFTVLREGSLVAGSPVCGRGDIGAAEVIGVAKKRRRWNYAKRLDGDAIAETDLTGGTTNTSYKGQADSRVLLKVRHNRKRQDQGGCDHDQYQCQHDPRPWVAEVQCVPNSPSLRDEQRWVIGIRIKNPIPAIFGRWFLTSRKYRDENSQQPQQ